MTNGFDDFYAIIPAGGTGTRLWPLSRERRPKFFYDLLGQVTQWQYYVTSQGRTEYWTNNMRRYVLLSLAYRFSLTPKKK